MGYRLSLGVLLAVLAVGCTSDRTATDSTTPTTAPTDVFDEDAYASQLEAKFTEATGGRTIEDICPDTFDTWHCFYQRIEVAGPSMITIHLSFPGDVFEEERSELAAQARLHFFNFVGPDFPDLDTIVSYSNGRDSGTTFRRNVPLLNRD